MTTVDISESGQTMSSPRPWGPQGARRTIEQLAERADVRISGGRPWDLQIHDARFFRRVLRDGSLGLGESYMEGWWDAERLDETFCRLMRSGVSVVPWNPALLLERLAHLLLNGGRPSKTTETAEHYNLGRDLFEAMLDPRLVYTCGYWDAADTLGAAQEAKLDLVCRKIGLKEGDRILDIGCGWGSFLAFAAERYGVRGLGVTISEEQATYARRRVEGLPVEIRLADYRTVNESEPFDHVVSLGMFEHVGVKNHRTFFEVVDRNLRDGGLLMLHTIGGNSSTGSTDPWLHRYIFPNSMLPSISQIGRATEGLFVMEDWHNFGTHYDRTLMAWHERFAAAWPSLRDRYDERFRRMWRYYLLQSAGLFRAREAQLWQVVLSGRGVRGGYVSLR